MQICKGFANSSSVNVEFSKTQLPKMIQSGGFITDISGITSSLDKFISFASQMLELLSKELRNTDMLDMI